MNTKLQIEIEVILHASEIVNIVDTNCKYQLHRPFIIEIINKSQNDTMNLVKQSNSKMKRTMSCPLYDQNQIKQKKQINKSKSIKIQNKKIR